jgi:hypothetical protein
MEKSESIGKLAEALAKAQGAIEGAKKDQANPFFRSKYADLSSVWEACRKPLSDNGLAIVQIPLVSMGDDNVLLQTVLTHSSGEWLSGVMSMKPVKSDPQGVGSCLTYLRRYCLSAFVGVAPEDDDGNAASNKTPVARQEPQPTNPLETKKYDMHPSEAKDVPDSTGRDEQTIDEATLIADKKKAISDRMLGFSTKQKKAFYAFTMGSGPETLDRLQEFLDRYIEYRQAYMNSVEAT